MKKYMKFAVAALCAMAFGLSACSDDDDAIKSVLKDPTLANVSESVSSLSFSWDKVDGATQYGYELTDPDGNMVSTDVTKKTSVVFTGLKPATTYTLSVWAYSKVYGDVGTSKIATLTGTTASTQPLDKPTLTAEVAAGVATVSWEEVAHATSYVYTYNDGGEEDVTGETSDLFLAISGLVVDRDYTVSVYAKSTDEVYTESESATVTFTMTHTEAWRVDGTYTSAHLAKSFPVTMIAYDDNTYTLLAWYGVDYYNFDFSVDDNGTITPYGDFSKNSKGEYIIPTGNPELPEIYLSNDIASTFNGNSRSGEVNIQTCNYGTGTDTFIWTPARQELWRAAGKYSSHVTGATYNGTIIAYDDNSYTLEPWYGVNGYNLELKIGADGSMELLSYYGIYDAGYWVNTGLDDDTYYGLYVWTWDGLSYLEGNRMAGRLVLCTAADGGAWGDDVFEWGDSAAKLTIDDLVGEYTYSTAGYQYLENAEGGFDYTGTYTVTKSTSDPNALVFDCFYWYDYPVEGVVDLDAMTVTIQPQYMGWYLFSGYYSTTDPVVGTIDANLNITFENWNLWYNFGTDAAPEWYYYVENTKTVFTKM